MPHTTSTRSALPAILLIILAGACRSPILDIADGATGRLLVAFPTASPVVGSRAGGAGSLSAVFGTIHSWTLLGEGPKGAKASIDFTASDASSGTVSVELALGDWSLTMKGFDADGSEVLSAACSVTIEAKDNNICTFAMAWAEKALVARLSFDTEIQDDKGRLIATAGNLKSSNPVITASSGLVAPALDGLSVAQITNADLDDSGAFIDIATADGNGLELGPSFTVCMWACPTSDYTAYEQVLMTSRSNAMTSSPGFTLSSLNGQVTLSCSNGSTTGSTVQAGYVYDQWNHIAITIDGESGYASIYVNAVRNGEPLVISGIPSNLAIRIGARMTSLGFFEGSFDDLRVYAGALSTEEIKAIHADGYFSGGLGTAVSPYLVATPMDLYNVRYFPAAHFRQTADIDLGASAMTSEWTPIPSFTGNYDGGGLKISNLKLMDGASYTGLFESLDGGSVVTNLALSGSSDQSGSFAKPAGALAGRIWGATVSDVTISGFTLTTSAECLGGLASEIFGTTAYSAIISNVTISDSSLSGASKVGGLVGYTHGSDAERLAKMTNCTIIDTTEITATGANVGGFVGHAASFSRFSSCTTGGSVVKNSSGNSIGGFVGYVSDSSYIDTVVIDDCHALGAVDAPGQFIGGFIGCISGNAISLTVSNCDARGVVSGLSYVGGFLGSKNDSSGSAAITDCTAYGNVTATNSYAGGFLGDAYGNTTIQRCSARGNVTGISSIGGFVGSARENTRIEYCRYSSSYVNATGTSSERNAGGFAGILEGSSTQTVTVNYCRSSGKVNNPSTGTSIGGFAGKASFAIVTQCLVDGNGYLSCGNSSCVGGFIGTLTSSGVDNCYTMSVISTGTDASETAGFIGMIQDTGTGAKTSIVRNCYTGGSQFNTEQSFLGAFTSSLSTTFNAEACYWRYGPGQTADHIFGINEITYTLTDWPLPDGWDDSIWYFNSSYPTLDWEHTTP